MQSAPLRIGTRGSPLALAQAAETRRSLAAAAGLDPEATTVVPIRTTGDRITDRPLLTAGGKGLFTKEIDEALLAGSIDLAVHSAKDMPTRLPDGILIAACLPRADVRDAFISPVAADVADLRPGAVVGTSSLRRAAMIKRQRPDVTTVDLRGNVQTRLARLEEGVADATLLAYAGLTRLGLTDRATAVLPTDTWLPAAGQGVIAIAARADDEPTRTLLARINHAASAIALAAERAFLAVLDGSCRTPIGALATVDGEALSFRGIIIKPDGSQAHEVARTAIAAASVAAAMGADAGIELAARGGSDFFAAV